MPVSGIGTIHGTANGCARCGQQFGALTAFDAHQDVDYGRNPAVLCREPSTLGLTTDHNGVWRMPQSESAAARFSVSEMAA